MSRRRVVIVIEYSSDNGVPLSKYRWESNLAKGHEYRPPFHGFQVEEIVEDVALPRMNGADPDS